MLNKPDGVEMEEPGWRNAAKSPLDQPHVVAGATAVLMSAGLADRCTLVCGDFFAALPRGGDAYLLRRIIHDWDDAQSVAILRKVREAMPDHVRELTLNRSSISWPVLCTSICGYFQARVAYVLMLDALSASPDVLVKVRAGGGDNSRSLHVAAVGWFSGI